MENNNDYPIYRKLSNKRSFYKILSDREFEEIQMIGTKNKRYKHEAKQYPEMLYIQDLVRFAHGGILESCEEEWGVFL